MTTSPASRFVSVLVLHKHFGPHSVSDSYRPMIMQKKQIREAAGHRLADWTETMRQTKLPDEVPTASRSVTQSGDLVLHIKLCKCIICRVKSNKKRKKEEKKKWDLKKKKKSVDSKLSLRQNLTEYISTAKTSGNPETWTGCQLSDINSGSMNQVLSSVLTFHPSTRDKKQQQQKH